MPDEMSPKGAIVYSCFLYLLVGTAWLLTAPLRILRAVRGGR